MLLSLPRKSVHRATPATVAAFSSTAPASLPAPTQKKGGGKPVTKKGQKVSFSSKKVNARKRKGDRQEKGKPPAVGERKAFRKRIVLSNTNALAVDGLKELKEETVINGETHGQVLALSNDLIDQLRASEAFQAKQSWGMFRQPSMLIREDTLKIAKMFEGSKNVDKKQGTTRQILVGARGTGKSVYLLQAMAFAFLNKWTVIHIPDSRFCPDTALDTDTDHPW
jgi:small subunit ribosomal protein S29